MSQQPRTWLQLSVAGVSPFDAAAERGVSVGTALSELSWAAETAEKPMIERLRRGARRVACEVCKIGFGPVQVENGGRPDGMVSLVETQIGPDGKPEEVRTSVPFLFEATTNREAIHPEKEITERNRADDVYDLTLAQREMNREKVTRQRAAIDKYNPHPVFA